jgi:hypothetical protein
VTAAFGYLYNESGDAPNKRHEAGVNAAKQYYRELGYDVSSTEEAVIVPGFPTPRVYDFIATDKAGVSIDVEVKTTLYSTIFLKQDQVDKDVAVANFGGQTSVGQVIDMVKYHAFCFNCYRVQVDAQAMALYLRLRAANVPVILEPKLPARWQ